MKETTFRIEFIMDNPVTITAHDMFIDRDAFVFVDDADNLIFSATVASVRTIHRAQPHIGQYEKFPLTIDKEFVGSLK